MQTYEPKDFRGWGKRRPLVFLPAASIDPHRIVLADVRTPMATRPAERNAAIERFMEIYREEANPRPWYVRLAGRLAFWRNRANNT